MSPSLSARFLWWNRLPPRPLSRRNPSESSQSSDIMQCMHCIYVYMYVTCLHACNVYVAVIYSHMGSDHNSAEFTCATVIHRSCIHMIPVDPAAGPGSAPRRSASPAGFCRLQEPDGGPGPGPSVIYIDCYVSAICLFSLFFFPFIFGPESSCRPQEPAGGPGALPLNCRAG
jgi:hypothetical protein